MESCENFYRDLQTKQQELHYKLKNLSADDDEAKANKEEKKLCKQLTIVNKLMDSVVKYMIEIRNN